MPLTPPPTHYGMRLETLRAEIELWLAEAAGHRAPLEPMSARPFAQALGAWTADTTDPNTWWGQLNNTAARVSLTQVHREGVAMWQADVEGDGTIDGADMFPRLFRTTAHAVSEMEALADWRWGKRPAEDALAMTNACMDALCSDMAPEQRSLIIQAPLGAQLRAHVEDVLAPSHHYAPSKFGP